MKENEVSPFDWKLARRVGVGLSLALSFGGAAWSDDAVDALLLADLPSVKGASRFEQRTLDAPASVSIVTAEEIRAFGHRTIAEILKPVRGFQVSEDRSYQYVGVRGFNLPSTLNKRVLLLLDGHRINNAVHGGFWIGEGGVVDASLIERVEIIRGPSSSLYGTSAFFAVINVVTRQGRSVDGVELACESGSESRRGRSLTVGKRAAGRSETLVHVSDVKDRGRDFYFPVYDLGGSDSGWARDIDGERAQRRYAKLHEGNLTVWAARVRRDKQFPSAPYGTVFADGGTRSYGGVTALELQYEPMEAGRDHLLARVFFDKGTISGTYVKDLGMPFGVVTNRDESDSESWGGELIFTRQVETSHRLSLGLDYRREIHIEQWNGLDEIPIVSVDQRNAEYTLGSFVQSELHFGERNLLNVGLRHDALSGRESFTAPRFALIHKLDEGASWKLLYGRAFRAASAFERFYEDENFLKANPDLRPESIDTWELVFEKEVSKHRRLSASVYRYDLDDFITRLPDPLDGRLVYQNFGRYRGKGFELEHLWRWGTGSVLSLSYAHADVKSATSSLAVPNSPRHDFKLHWSQPLGGSHWAMGTEVLFRSERSTLGGERIGSDAICNLNFNRKASSKAGAELSLRVLNVFDRDRVDVVGPEHNPIEAIPLDGRAVQLRCSFRF